MVKLPSSLIGNRLSLIQLKQAVFCFCFLIYIFKKILHLTKELLSSVRDAHATHTGFGVEWKLLIKD